MEEEYLIKLSNLKGEITELEVKTIKNNIYEETIKDIKNRLEKLESDIKKFIEKDEKKNIRNAGRKKSINEEKRTLVNMYKAQGMKQKDIAEMLGISTGSVSLIIKKAGW